MDNDDATSAIASFFAALEAIQLRSSSKQQRFGSSTRFCLESGSNIRNRPRTKLAFACYTQGRQLALATRLEILRVTVTNAIHQDQGRKSTN
jgi:hypothetical protein